MPQLSPNQRPQAKLPVMALMGVSLLGERLLIDRLHMWLDLDGSDQVGGGSTAPLPAAAMRRAGL